MLCEWLGVEYAQRRLEYLKAENKTINLKLNNLIDGNNRLSTIGVDLNFQGQSQIIILTKLNGGGIRFVNVNFKDAKHLEHTVKDLQYRFQSFDAPTFDTANRDLTEDLNFRFRG